MINIRDFEKVLNAGKFLRNRFLSLDNVVSPSPYTVVQFWVLKTCEVDSFLIVSKQTKD